MPSVVSEFLKEAGVISSVGSAAKNAGFALNRAVNPKITAAIPKVKATPVFHPGGVARATQPTPTINPLSRAIRANRL